MKIGFVIFSAVLISGCTSIAQSLMSGKEAEYQEKVKSIELNCKVNLNYEAFGHSALQRKLLPIIKVGTSEECLISIMQLKDYKVNKTTTSYGISKQYIVTTGYKYISQSAGSIPSEFMYIYTDNNKVTSFQN